MSKKKKRQNLGQAQHRQRELDTIREVHAALEGDLDLRRLRQLAAVRGLVNAPLRARLWPVLAGAAGDATEAAAGDGTNNNAADDGAGADDEDAAYAAYAAGAHRDSAVVECDVARSLWAFMPGASDAERGERRAALTRVLTAAVVRHNGAVHYYQGLHDVASVLLLVAGERAAYKILCRLVTGPLRDATRPTLDPVLEVLGGLMPAVLSAADPELARAADEVGLPPYYALPWVITWFSHGSCAGGGSGGLDAAARLFDLLLATHPAMPLYVGAVAMASQRGALLAAARGDGGMPALHTALANLCVTRALTADDLACGALALYRQAPPNALIARRALRMEMAVSPRAYRDKVTGMWRVPEPSRDGTLNKYAGKAPLPPPPPPPRTLLRQAVAAPLALLGGRGSSDGDDGAGAPPAGALLSLGLYAAVAAGAWLLVRLQAQSGGTGGLPWAPS